MQIQHRFRQIADAQHKDVVLHNIPPSIVKQHIAIFLEHQLRIIAKQCYQYADCTSAEAIRLLVWSASDLSIWAATACLFIREGLFPDVRLRVLDEGRASADAGSP